MVEAYRTCSSCQYQWRPRVGSPRRCPACQAWQRGWETREERAKPPDERVPTAPEKPRKARAEAER